MKKTILTALISIIIVIVFAQSPLMINYQAVLHDNLGNVLLNDELSIDVKIIQGSPEGTVVFSETHATTTNNYGIVNLIIGSVESLDGINWNDDDYFIQIWLDETEMGTSQLLSVPYAFHAKTAETVENIEITGLETVFDNWDKDDTDDFSGNYNDLIGLPSIFDGDYNSLTNLPVLFAGNWSSLQGTAPDISIFNNDAGYITNPDDDDADTNNEIQDLLLDGNILTITQNGSATPIDLSIYVDESNYQTLTLAGTELSILNGNTVYFTNWDTDISDDFSGNYNDLTNQPTIPIVPENLSDFVNDAGFITEYTEIDGDVTNEIEMPTDAEEGDMSYFNGTDWIVIEAPTVEDLATYTMEWDVDNNKPYWKAKIDFPTVEFNGTMYIYPIDNSSSVFWGTQGVTIGADSNTDGESNTDMIVASEGEGEYAASICANLVSYGYDDWYLPSIDELDAMYQNLATIGMPSSGLYWSSTESGSHNVLEILFSNGNQIMDGKNFTRKVRCVRKD